MQQTKSMKQIESITSKGVSETNNKLVKEIPLDLLDPHPMNSQIYTTEGIEGLCHSIKESGFFGAIDVYQKNDGRYMIVSGHRRFLAMKQLGRKTIPALIYKMEPEDIILRKLIEANQNTRTPSPMEKAMEIVAYEESLLEGGYQGRINDKLCAVFNMSLSKLHKVKSIVKLTDELKKYAYDLTFPYEAFSNAVNFSKEQQVKLAGLIEKHLTTHPDAELSSILATQFIEQIKTETKLEKERKEREKVLKQAEKIIKEQSLEMPAASDSLKNESPSEESETYEAQELPLEEPVELVEENTPPLTLNTPMEINADISDIIVKEELPIQEIYEKEEEKTNIDFDLSLYTKKMLEKLENTNTVISVEVKEKIMLSINRIIDLLNKK